MNKIHFVVITLCIIYNCISQLTVPNYQCRPSDTKQLQIVKHITTLFILIYICYIG